MEVASLFVASWVLCLMHVVLSAAAPHAEPYKPYVDAGYEELISTRFYLDSAAPVYGWERLPFATPPTRAAAARVTIIGSVQELAGFYVIGGDQIIFISGSDASFLQHPVGLGSIPVDPSTCLGVDPATKHLTIVATSTSVYHINCSLSGASISCSIIDSLPVDFQFVNGIAVIPSGNGAAYIASNTGGYLYEGLSNVVHLLQAEVPVAVAYYAPRQLLAFGGNESVTTYVNNVFVRRDWVTDVVNGAGGAYDGPVSSLAFDSLGWLFVGNSANVNILFPNMTVNHLSRFQGLPYNVTTSVSIEATTRK